MVHFKNLHWIALISHRIWKKILPENEGAKQALELSLLRLSIVQISQTGLLRLCSYEVPLLIAPITCEWVSNCSNGQKGRERGREIYLSSFVFIIKVKLSVLGFINRPNCLHVKRMWHILWSMPRNILVSTKKAFCWLERDTNKDEIWRTV